MKIAVDVPEKQWFVLRDIAGREREPKRRASVAAVVLRLISRRVEREAAKASSEGGVKQSVAQSTKRLPSFGAAECAEPEILNATEEVVVATFPGSSRENAAIRATFEANRSAEEIFQRITLAQECFIDSEKLVLDEGSLSPEALKHLIEGNRIRENMLAKLTRRFHDYGCALSAVTAARKPVEHGREDEANSAEAKAARIAALLADTLSPGEVLLRSASRTDPHQADWLNLGEVLEREGGLGGERAGREAA